MADVRDGFVVYVHVKHKEIPVVCGGDDAPQKVRWLGNVAIARYDDTNFEGWRELGAPTSVRRADAEGEELNLDDVIGDCLRSGDHVYVSTSLGSA